MLRAPRVPTNRTEIARWRRLIVVLEQCPLVVEKVGDFDPVLLNAGEHARHIASSGRQVVNFRPDIVHQCLVTLQESPLNAAARLQVYIRTTNNHLIAVNPHFKVPISYSAFASCIVALFQKHKVRAALKPQPLLRLITCDVPKIIPIGAPVFVATVDGVLVDPARFAAATQATLPHGALASAHVEGMVVASALTFPRGATTPVARKVAAQLAALRPTAAKDQSAKRARDAAAAAASEAPSAKRSSSADKKASAAHTPSKGPKASKGRPADFDSDGDVAPAAGAVSVPLPPYPVHDAAQRPIVVVIGGFAHGELTQDVVPYGHLPHVCFAPTSLSAAACCAMLAHGFERVWLGDGAP